MFVALGPELSLGFLAVVYNPLYNVPNLSSDKALCNDRVYLYFRTWRSIVPSLNSTSTMSNCETQHSSTTADNDNAEVLSSISHLPVELLSEIFLFSLPDAISPDINQVPLSLGRVSRLWRNTAYATPFLWSKIAFYKFHILQRYQDNRGLKEWLARSQPLGLTIDITGTITPMMDIIIDVILTHCGRWEAVTCHGVGITAVQIMLNKAIQRSGTLPALRTFDTSWLPTGAIIADLATHFPTLERFTAKRVQLVYHPTQQPHRVLRELSLVSVSSCDNLFQTLKLFPCLETLHVLLTGTLFPDTRRRVSCASLKTFSITLDLFGSKQIIEAVLNCIALPCVTSFGFVISPTKDRNQFCTLWNPFFALLRRSRAPLLRLQTDIPLKNAQDLVSFSQSAPTLEELLVLIHATDDILGVLTVSETQRLFPQLKTMMLVCDEKACPTMLLGMIRSRWRDVSQKKRMFQKVTVFYTEDKERWQHPEAMEYIGEGLDLKFEQYAVM